ncbi:MAG TPA: VanW family protein [Allosphingosinicella sp.]|nr:VanW family protein [Allosphingosinicella sp.]
MRGGEIAIRPGEAHGAPARFVFWAKSRLLIARRALVNLLAGRARLSRAPLPAGATLIARDEHRLYTLADPRERALELGKVQNLRIAAAALDGIVLAPGETFSFWRAAGRASRAKGYVTGRELRLGCMIPSIGGGICQLTNALSRVAHQGGMEIIERHSHSVHPEGFFIDDATDATVFWNYIDFRFRSPRRVRIGASLTETTLVVRLDALP